MVLGRLTESDFRRLEVALRSLGINIRSITAWSGKIEVGRFWDRFWGSVALIFVGFPYVFR